MSKTHRKQQECPQTPSRPSPPSRKQQMREALARTAQDSRPVEFPQPDVWPLKPMG